ncbi:MAG TPA: Gfo/Idh/MocA family oxidoreductase [Terriglobia bacterium]|nr:Gfo/Idh/MocA family oxidoreductase [Terriglobia bacterium]
MDERNIGLTRREFLKDTAAVSAGVAAFGGLAPARILGANDRIRLGLLGAGERGDYVMTVFAGNPDVEVVAICDVYEPHRLKAQLDSKAQPQLHTDYREVLDRKDVDAVLIASPDHWHKQMLIDAVKAGKDAYCEKPIMHSIPEGVEMVNAVKESNRVVQCGMQQRSWPHWVLAKQIVDDGMLGQICFVHTYWYQNYYADRGWMSRHHVDTNALDWKKWLGSAPDQPYSDEKFAHWRFFWDFGGGILTDLLTHWIDMIQWYLGQPAPQTATTTGDLYLMKWQCPDTITAVYEYPGNTMVTFTGALGGSIDDGGVELRGTKATLKVDRSRLAVYPEGVEWDRSDAIQEPPAQVFVRSEHDGTIEHVRNFLDCVRSRKTPNAGIEVGFEAARTSWLGNIALQRGLKTVWNASEGKVGS